MKRDYAEKTLELRIKIAFLENHGWTIYDSDVEDYIEECMTEEQLQLRRTVLESETIPAGIDLLVINAASQTCIKIQGEKRKVDFIIVHNKNEEVKTQVRGRYHGDLPYFYFHDIEAANDYAARQNGACYRFLILYYLEDLSSYPYYDEIMESPN